jgi:superfamily II DNA or RNA helicase/HKD family nuclease
MTKPADGLYDSLLTHELVAQIQDFDFVVRETVTGETLDKYLLKTIAKELINKFQGLKKSEDKIEFANELLGFLGSNVRVFDGADAEVLLALVFDKNTGTKHLEERPSISLSDLGLLTNSRSGLSAGSELRKELPSADNVMILMAFVRKAGIAHIEKQLAVLRDRKVEVRLITSVYMGGTQADALDRLVNEFNVKVKVSYDADVIRLHAKAWLIERETGFSTAIIGSSNMSDSAMSSGVEWNVRMSSVSSPEVLDQFRVAFETFWNSTSFKEYIPGRDRETLDEALKFANSSSTREESFNFIPNLEVEPRRHQSKMLEDLSFEREVHFRHRNLVVAATGTGKTVLAALDYQRLQKNLGIRPTLLFIAHRKEILKQALNTYRAVLKDKNFGELYVDGQVPGNWKHVFASVQSLSSKDIENLKSEAFEVVVIDEFHHATATTYKKIIDHLKPVELLGLTATPERSEGLRVQDEFFEGRIASELRLWDAMDQGLLAPFEYFGIGESKSVVDYSAIDWSGGKYQTSALSKAVTGNDLRDHLVLREIENHVDDPRKMRALIFCVDVNHANYVAEMLAQKRGLKAVSITGTTNPTDRERALTDLRDGRIQAITSVDVLNEGVDIPEVDTIIMLRPTESSVIFIQQLGRGLRKAFNKSAVTVLDFIGLHRADFRIDKKLGAIVGQSRRELKEQVEKGFPNLPTGISISLDSIAQEYVINNLKDQLTLGLKKLTSEVQAVGTLRLTEFIEKSGISLSEILDRASWSEICIDAGLLRGAELSELDRNLLSKSKRLAHIDDAVRVDGFLKIILQGLQDWGSVSEYERRLVSMLFWNLFPDAKLPNQVEAESFDEAFSFLRLSPIAVDEYRQVLEAARLNFKKITPLIKFQRIESPLCSHASYSRDELLGAVAWANLEANPIIGSAKKTRKAKGHQVGVSYLADIELDLLFINLIKEESKFSISTRYHDYALTPEIFCWDSQNSASQDSGDGARYINQKESRHDVLLAMREKSNGGSFKLLGLADFVSASGNKPIKIQWKLRAPLDTETFAEAVAVKTA